MAGEHDMLFGHGGVSNSAVYAYVSFFPALFGFDFLHCVYIECMHNYKYARARIYIRIRIRTIAIAIAARERPGNQQTYA